MALRIGVVDFLNAYPLYYALENSEECTLIRDVPSKLSQLLYQGDCDAALISSAEYFRNKENYTLSQETGIYADGKIESIRLFSPLANEGGELSGPVLELYLDYASRSSTLLSLYCLRKLFPGVWPVLRPAHPPYEVILDSLGPTSGLLLIGDPALHNRHRQSVDLGKTYKELTGQGFLYAVWAMKKDPGIPDRFFAKAWAQSCIEWEDMLVQAGIQFGFSAEFTKKYLEEIIIHEITPVCVENMMSFYEECTLMGITAHMQI